ncbi:uncharacterized protein LOC135959774 [Calliphora vicina]|uniref:uncharacterized protein LOC135959774 n=1 Tax=Calliphora vicina TaxID=7373 RepID=UPI00325C05F2
MKDYDIQKSNSTLSLTICKADGEDNQIKGTGHGKGDAVGETGSALKKVKSPTTLLCELTRLKTQQKYLEYAEVKLNVSSFQNNDKFSSTSSSLPNLRDSTVTHIEQLRIQIEGELNAFLQQSRATVNDIYLEVEKIKENIQPDRLDKYSVADLRQHIVCINTEIEKFKLKNSNQLLLLQKSCEDLFN